MKPLEKDYKNSLKQMIIGEHWMKQQDRVEHELDYNKGNKVSQMAYFVTKVWIQKFVIRITKVYSMKRSSKVFWSKMIKDMEDLWTVLVFRYA